MLSWCFNHTGYYWHAWITTDFLCLSVLFSVSDFKVSLKTPIQKTACGRSWNTNAFDSVATQVSKANK